MKSFTMVLLAVVLVVAAMSHPGESRSVKNKRFLFKEISQALHNVGDFFTKTYNSAKDAFNKLGASINFDAAVNALIPYIHSGMTVTACNGACIAAAASVLGPAAALAGTLCTPVCEGALAKLEELAG